MQGPLQRILVVTCLLHLSSAQLDPRCVEPSMEDRECGGAFRPYFHYNSDTNRCLIFTSSCDNPAGTFETLQECQDVCYDQSVQPTCKFALPDVTCAPDWRNTGEEDPCPENYVCKSGVPDGVCCPQDREQWFADAYSETCPGNRAAAIISRGAFRFPYISHLCEELECPSGFECIEINDIFVKCCANLDQTLSLNEEVKKCEPLKTDAPEGCEYIAEPDEGTGCMVSTLVCQGNDGSPGSISIGDDVEEPGLDDWGSCTDEDKEWVNNGSPCPDYCGAPPKWKRPCTRNIVPGCFCKRGLVLAENDMDALCVPTSECFPTDESDQSLNVDPTDETEEETDTIETDLTTESPDYGTGEPVTEEDTLEDITDAPLTDTEPDFSTNIDTDPDTDTETETETETGTDTDTDTETETGTGSIFGGVNCGPEKEWKNCTSLCPPTCEYIQGSNDCVNKCQKPACYCIGNLVLSEDDPDAECVLPVDCPSDDVPTLENLDPDAETDEGAFECLDPLMEFDSLAPGCPRTCRRLQPTDDDECLEPARAGCACKPEYVLLDQYAPMSRKKCVRPQNCPPEANPKGDWDCTDPDRYFAENVPLCPIICNESPMAKANCPFGVRDQCLCKAGFLPANEDLDAPCVPISKCNNTVATIEPIGSGPLCPPNEMFNECNSACEETCDEVPTTCNFLCVKGCACKPGFVRKSASDPTCIRKEQCNAKPTGETCSRFEIFNTCGTDAVCEETCQGKRNFCSRRCFQGCFCQEGYVRASESDRRCIPRQECDRGTPSRCGLNEEYSECGAACQDACNKRTNICTLQCESGCVCKRGYVRKDVADLNSPCVPKRTCGNIRPIGGPRGGRGGGEISATRRPPPTDKDNAPFAFTMKNSPIPARPIPADSCRDENKLCPQWAATGACETNSGWMMLHCQKSCSCCGCTFGDLFNARFPDPCKDRHAVCPAWKKYDQCTTNYEYMEIYCRGSCSIC